MEKVYIIKIGENSYYILKEIVYQDIHYLYLSNTMDPDDVLIRKTISSEPDHYFPLESLEEVHLASFLLLNE